MGITFVTVTLTAVHHLRAEDSGIGSGVLNTMQQVGGAVGLAVLSTVALHFFNGRAASVGPQLASGIHKAGQDPTAVVPGTGQRLLDGAIYQASFPEGAVHAFEVGTVMMLVASAIIWLFLNVKHTELATDGPEGGVHVA